MTDIALAFSGTDLRADWLLGPRGLVAEAGLRSAVAVSLFSDALARTDDVIPDGTDDRRGWWGDLPREGQPPDPLGSRLWLLVREKRTEKTRRRAEDYAKEALAWMVKDGVAAEVAVSASWGGARGDQLRLVVTVSRRANGVTASEVFAMYWQQEAAR